MSGLLSIAESVAKIKAIEHDTEELGPEIVARTCEMVCREVKEVLGPYHYGWEHLQPATIGEKDAGRHSKSNS